MDNEAPKSEVGKPLLGSSEAVVDSKGRILIAKKQRERLGPGFAVCLGLKGCLEVYPAHGWEKVLAVFEQFDPTDPARQDWARLVLPTADDELNCDDQGRVVVHHKLRELAGLKDRVIILGCYDRLEIWDAAKYEAMVPQNDMRGKSILEAISATKKNG